MLFKAPQPKKAFSLIVVMLEGREIEVRLLPAKALLLITFTLLKYWNSSKDLISVIPLNSNPISVTIAASVSLNSPSSLRSKANTHSDFTFASANDMLALHNVFTTNDNKTNINRDTNKNFHKLSSKSNKITKMKNTKNINDIIRKNFKKKLKFSEFDLNNKFLANNLNNNKTQTFTENPLSSRGELKKEEKSETLSIEQESVLVRETTYKPFETKNNKDKSSQGMIEVLNNKCNVYFDNNIKTQKEEERAKFSNGNNSFQ